MHYILQVEFTSKAEKQKIIDLALAITKERRGKIASLGEEEITIYFGNKLITRLLGVWFLSDFKSFQFPTKLNIKFQYCPVKKRLDA